MEEKQTERLIAEDVHLRYDDVTALRGCGLSVSPGLAVVLVGPSGSGKTTLLWLLAGLCKPDTGRTGILRPGGQLDHVQAGELGMVFQHPMLWEHLSVEQHLKLVLAGKNLSRQERCKQIDATLSRMRLHSLRRRKPGQLSGGEKQRLSIARAIVAQPRWLLLDEPLTHLDGSTRTELMYLLREILRETRVGVVLATHNATEALRLGEEICVMLAGQIVQCGSSEKVYRQPINLDVARVLGPVGVLRGYAGNGVFSLNEGGNPVLRNLDPSITGMVSGLLRPEDVRFHVEESGPAKVMDVEYIGNGYYLRIEIPGTEPLLVLSDTKQTKGTPGALSLFHPKTGHWLFPDRTQEF